MQGYHVLSTTWLLPKCKNKLENYRIWNFCPTTHFFLSCYLPGIEPVSTVKLPITLTNKTNTLSGSGERLLSLHVHETIPISRMVNLHLPIVKIPFPDISSPKSQSVHLVCFSLVHFYSPLCKVWWSKDIYRRKVTSSNLDLFLSKEQKQDSTRKLRFSLHQMFHKY